VLRRIGESLIRTTSPVVRRVARAYGLRVDEHCVALGQHPLVIEHSAEEARACIPRTVMFNTRSGSIRVGRNTVFGEEVMILTGAHLDVVAAAAAGVEQHFVPEDGRDISIGRGCYVGSRAILIGPLVVGDCAVIAAGAVVTHDVPARTMVAGVPARVVKAL